MKYCTHCGAELFDEAVICPKCYSEIGETKTASTPQNKWSGLAIAGFIVSFFNGIAGLIMSIIGLKRARSSGENGKKLALAGIVISAVHLAFVTIDFICWIIYFYMSRNALVYTAMLL